MTNDSREFGVTTYQYINRL